MPAFSEFFARIVSMSPSRIEYTKRTEVVGCERQAYRIGRLDYSQLAVARPGKNIHMKQVTQALLIHAALLARTMPGH